MNRTECPLCGGRKDRESRACRGCYDKSGRRNPMFGKTHTAEARQRMGDARRIPRPNCLQCGNACGRLGSTFCSHACHASYQRSLRSQRFWSRVEIADSESCWEWTGSKTQGYGTISFDGFYRAHRYAYELTYGGVRPRDVIMHSCDNRGCCNPAHLSLGTIAENNADKEAKGRSVILSGSQHGSSRLTEEQVREIRRRREGGESMYALAREFGVTRPTIRSVVRRETWAAVS